MNNKIEYSRILIVDDALSNLDLMKSVLQDDQLKIASAKDGKSALLKVRAYHFDLILLDIILPDIDGFEVCRQMKNRSLNEDTPVIFLTGMQDKENLIKGFRLGAVDFIRKPFLDEELRARVNLHLSLKQTQKELIQARDIAERALREKSLFLANMSHEIRTPLNGIVGMTDIMADTDLNKQQKEYLDIINISSDTLLTIINDILDFSKIEAGQVVLEKIDYDLKKELEKIYKLFVYQSREKHIELSLDIDPDTPVFLQGDPTRLRQILVNLINNAIKFTSKGSVHVFVKLEQQLDDEVELLFLIKDTGIGISSENQEKLFHSFTQADASTTRKFGGTGLGLAISRQLVLLMNGKIGVESVLGQGSEFWFTIRNSLSLGGRPAVSRNYNGNRDQQQRKLKILLAEDNKINQKVFLLIIERLGYEVVLAGNGKEAVAFFEEDSFDLILMDIQMPVMDGVEATCKIRRMERKKADGSHIPIIAMSANQFREDVEQWMQSGMDDHLGKPFKSDDLQEAINQNVLLKK